LENLELLLIALPAIIMFGYTIYLKKIHEGAPNQHALVVGVTYAILAAGFFVLLFIVKHYAHRM